MPAYNEALSIEAVISRIPKKENLEGIDKVTVLVVDDGSDDNTGRVAGLAGADEIIRHPWRRGLAKAFCSARQKALELGAGIMVILDADGQYDGCEINDLIKPLIQKKADIVIGDRQVKKRKFMPFGNRWGNIIGSFVIRLLLRIPVRDASCGFRALSSKALEAIDIFSTHTYTHEMLIHARAKDMRIVNIPVNFKPRIAGSSKLIRSLPDHLSRCVSTILRCILTVNPLKNFLRLGGLVVSGGTIAVFLSVPAVGSLDHWLLSGGIIFLFIGVQLITVGLVAEVLIRQKSDK